MAKSANPFAVQGEWFRGNLHTHTTASDGEYSPQGTVDHYARNGYDFLAISDHNRLVDPGELDGRGMALLPAVEINAGNAAAGQQYHWLCVGPRSDFERPETPNPAEALGYLRARFDLVFLAHPYWSSLTVTDMMACTGYDGLEVFNYSCELGIGRGGSWVHWDSLAERELYLPAIAVDDAHMHYNDACGGWIMVKAARLDAASIMEALRQGLYYASTGPEIRLVEIRDGVVHVECSPCRRVSMVVARAGRGWTTDRTPEPPETVEAADLPLETAAEFPFRIQVIDHAGRAAWTGWFFDHLG